MWVEISTSVQTPRIILKVYPAIDHTKTRLVDLPPLDLSTSWDSRELYWDNKDGISLYKGYFGLSLLAYEEDRDQDNANTTEVHEARKGNNELS